MPRSGPGFEKKAKSSSLPAITEAPNLGSVAVVGAGVSGLAAAYRLKKEGLKVTVFDSQTAPGGAIQSYSKNGFIWDRGANTMAANSPLVEKLIEELHLEDKRIFPRQQNKRFIVRDGKAEQLPTNPFEFFTTKLLSTPAKLRMVAEPLMWKRRERNAEQQDEDESLGSFLERHIGREPVDYMVDPFCAGTSGSDPGSLSARHAFPDLWELEKSHGSLLVGALAANLAKSKEAREKAKQGLDAADGQEKGQEKKKLRGSFSFLGGMQTLPNALAQDIGSENLQLGTAVQKLACKQHSSPAGSSWTVSVLQGDAKKPQDKQFDAVLVTAPLHSLQHLRIAKDGKPYTPELPPVTYQPMSMLVNAFRAQDVLRPLPGFGVLVPSVEQKASGFQSIGTLFSSFMFPDRAPAGEVLFTSFVGGSRNRDLALQPVDKLQEIVLRDLKRLLGVEGSPTFTQHVSWQQAFPEYGKGYGKVLRALDKLEKDLPGFYYAGNHRGGLAVGKALASGYDAAGLVIADLRANRNKLCMAAVC